MGKAAAAGIQPGPGHWARATRTSGSAGSERDRGGSVNATACTYMETSRNTGSPTRWRGVTSNRDRGGSSRRALPSIVARARGTLLHPKANRLTVRQRAALAWQTQGLVSVNIARRMATTPQNVRNLIVAARWRLERLSRPKPRKRPRSVKLPKAENAPPPPCVEDIHIEWAELLAAAVGSSPSARP